VALGRQIQRRRLEHQLSQEQLADRAGLSMTYVGMLERGERNLPAATMFRLARAMGLSLSELVGDLS
jgi:transcriptional regulator with XRE-family HTH domain